jgi:cyclopropane-fatty-acyl-phospholipid synthase
VASADRALIAARRFADRVFPHPRNYALRWWTGHVDPPDDPAGPQFTLVIKHPGTLRRMFSPPIELNAAEAFIRGEFDIEGDIFRSYDLLYALGSLLRTARAKLSMFLAVLRLPVDHTRLTQITRGQAELSGAAHSHDRDRRAIEYHYDVGNAFYSLFLDARMVYTCAFFRTGTETLDQAQTDKLDIICRKLRLNSGDTVLDIGCGWGGFAIYAAQHYNVRVTGVTLSKEQHALATERVREAGLADRVHIELRDYRDLGSAQFDKLVSIGMFEAVGRSHLPEYFAHAFRLLKPCGVFLNHGISCAPDIRGPVERWFDRRIMGRDLFSARYIFPDGELVPVSDVNLMAERAGFEVRDVENWREHYAQTLWHWATRLEANRERAIAVAGETVYRTWKLYMSGAVQGFKTNRHNLCQTLLSKNDSFGASGLPRSRADWYLS